MDTLNGFDISLKTVNFNDPLKIYESLNSAQIYNTRKTTERINRQFGAFIIPAFENRHDSNFLQRYAQPTVSVKGKSAKQDFNTSIYIDLGLKRIEQSIKDLMLFSKDDGNNEIQNIKIYDSKSKDDSDSSIKPIIIRINPDKVREIHTQLSSLGFNVGSMYPDIEHQSKYIIEKLKK